MKTIGIRAHPKQVTYAIFDSSSDAVLNIETVKIPAALATPDALKYIRSTILDILQEYSVDQGGLRLAETTSQSISTDRIYLEGVIQESFASSNLHTYYVGQIANIARRLGIPRENFKKIVEGNLDYEKIDNWQKLNKEEREALLAAIGASRD